jgi:putative oxidoreductase
LQRLFSTFANGWPGRGLLVLRIAVASFTLYNCLRQMGGWTSSSQGLLSVIAASAALLLLVGLWTPVAAALITVVQAWYWISRPQSSWDVFLGGSIAIALILLGPGASSVDAHMYGRKRISIGNR